MKAVPLTMQSNMEKCVEKTIAALRRNGMNGIFVETVKDIVPTVEKMLFDGCTITAGGSVTLSQSGVRELISSEKYNFTDRSKPGISEDEKLAAYKAAIGCDFFFCSSNAVTQNGELVNVDGFCNRVASIGFGPKKVIAVVGINKLVSDVNEGFLRIKRIAAPKNCVRLGIDAPCAKLGKCVSLVNNDNPAITDGCDSPRRICAGYFVTGHQLEKDRITVIICGEELGY